MNEMIITNAEFGSIRIEMRNGEPWFVGSSIAKVLKYQNQQKAIRDHVDAEDKLTEQIVLAGQRREVTLINESGLYSLILSSKMEEAKRFKHWITSEVLPAIRKTGGYQQTAPQGEKTALANSESIPAGAWIEFTVQCLTDTMAGAVAEWFDYGALRGLGQWRNSGKGRYLWDWLDEKGNVIGGNRSVHKDGK